MRRKKTEIRYPSLEESKRILAEAAPEDFDGHTSFADLTPEQRIRWASLSARAVHAARRVREDHAAKRYGKDTPTR
ncbi:MAG: hypothetical protein JXB04_01570 [Kiritimatiellae bacterium]|nr:hypothetical protein [Kiritimatiellia bacterium]